jgi:uracil-DNA glycosylase family 4
VGPAGRLLEELLDNTFHSLVGYNQLIRVGYSNLCCCIPKKADDTVKFHGVRPPSKEEIKACYPRLMELIKLADPRVVVCLGDVTFKGFTKETRVWKYKLLQLTHPSAILQTDNRSRQEIMKKRFILDLKEALELIL